MSYYNFLFIYNISKTLQKRVLNKDEKKFPKPLISLPVVMNRFENVLRFSFLTCKESLKCLSI